MALEHLWITSTAAPALHCVDMRTGAVDMRPIRGDAPHLIGTFGEWVVAAGGRGWTFYHRTRPAQRLMVRNAAQSVTGVFDDLVLDEQGPLRVFRLVKDTGR